MLRDNCFLGIKKVLASPGNEDILGGLIADFIGVAAEEITIKNPYNIAAYKEFAEGEEITMLRQTEPDISATFKQRRANLPDNAADFISEMQIKKDRYFNKRVLKYLFDCFCANYDLAGHMEIDPDGRPNRYSSLRPVYSLNILGESYFKHDDKAFRMFDLYDPENGQYYPGRPIRFGFFELAKSGIQTANQKHWRDYFKTGRANPEARSISKRQAGLSNGQI
jgi:hypothetical protein